MIQKQQFKILLLIVGSAIFCVLIYKVGTADIYHNLCILKWKILFLPLSYFVVFILDTLGWKYSFKQTDIYLKDLFAIRLAGESINVIIPSANFAGEPVKAYLLKKHKISMVEGLASVVISKTIMTISQIVFVMLGVGLLLSQLHLSGTRLVSIIAITLLGIPLILFILFIQKRGIFLTCFNLLRKFGIRIGFVEKNVDRLIELDKNILEFYSSNKNKFYLSFIFYFLGWVAGLIEVFLILYLLNIPINICSMYIIESLSSVAKGITSFIPGSVGGQEGGIIMIFLKLKLGAAIAITFCILRRLRELIWVASGLIVLSKLEWEIAESSLAE